MIIIKSDLNGSIPVPQVMVDILLEELRKSRYLGDDDVVNREELVALLESNEEFLIQWFLWECFPRLSDFFPEYPLVPEEVAEFVRDMVTGFVPPHGGYPFSQKTEVQLDDMILDIYTFEWLPPPGEEKRWQPYQLIVKRNS